MIKIKKSKKGTLHDALNISKDKKIPASKLKIKDSDSPALKKKKQFALNARKWKKGEYGMDIGPGDPLMPAPQNPAWTNFGDINGNIPQTPTIYTDTPSGRLNNATGEMYYAVDPMQQSYQTPISQIKNDPKDKKKKNFNYGDAALQGLLAIDALLPGEKIRRNYFRPEDMPYLNQNPYGRKSQAIAKYGMKMNNGGNVETVWGGDAQQTSYNPYDGGTLQFNGQSHDNGGIGITYAGKPAEVEGGETAFKSFDGSMNIMGAMKVPGTNKTFKQISKTLAKEEIKTQKFIDKGSELTKINPKDKFEMLSFNSGKVMAEGGMQKQKQLSDMKQNLAMIQNIMLQDTTSNKAKNGKTIPLYAEGGNINNNEPEPLSRIDSLYGNLIQKTEMKLKSMFPGRNIKVMVDESFGKNGERPLTTQRGIRAAGNSNTDVSLHNFGGARDFKIFIDGRYVSGLQKGDADIYKKALWTSANELGLHTASEWKNKGDLGHVGLVSEGRHTRSKSGVFKDLMTTYPELVTNPTFAGSLSTIADRIGKGQASPQELNAYNQLTGNKTKFKTTKVDYKKEYIPLKKNQKLYNEMIVQDDDLNNQFVPTVDLENYKSTNTFAPVNTSTPAITPYNPQRVTVNPGKVEIKQPKEYQKPSNAEPLDFNQIIPEAYSVLTSRQDPVKTQLYYPQLYQPYSVSFQDRINENNAQFQGIQKQVAYNPTALSALSPQLYQANNAVQADEFRTNQAIFNDVNNKNIALLNDAQLKNLGILDQQYVRQTQSQANTRKQNFEALESTSNKYAQNKLNNRTLQVYENLYPHYAYNAKNNLQVQKFGAPGQDYLNWGNNVTTSPSTTNPQNLTKVEKTYDNNKVEKIKEIYEQPKQKDFTDLLKNIKFTGNKY